MFGSDWKDTVLVVVPLFALFLIAEGCAALGLATPQTFNQKVEVAYGAVQGIASTTDTLFKAGKINSAVAGNIQIQDQNLKVAIDIAVQTYATNQTDGGNVLQTALSSLQALTAYLTTLQPTTSGSASK